MGAASHYCIFIIGYTIPCCYDTKGSELLGIAAVSFELQGFFRMVEFLMKGVRFDPKNHNGFILFLWSILIGCICILLIKIEGMSL